MNADHWILLGAWLLFGLLHSLTAAGWFKELFRKGMGPRFVYYRLLYSMLALLSLGAVLVWQFSIPSSPVGSFPLLKYMAGLPVGALGALLMGICIRKYFFDLSGLSVFWKKEKGGGLGSGGLHRYVRHPLYLGTLLFLWSLFLFFPLLSNLLAGSMITLYTLIGIRLEEKKLLLEFGADYVSYQRRTPMLIPDLAAIFRLH